ALTDWPSPPRPVQPSCAVCAQTVMSSTCGTLLIPKPNPSFSSTARSSEHSSFDRTQNSSFECYTTHPAHLVAVPPIVADHLRALVGDMLGDGGQEVRRREHLEIAVDLGIEPGAVDDDVPGRLQRHLLHRERG